MKTLSILLLCVSLSAYADITIYPVAPASGPAGGVSGQCPGQYKAFTTYVKTIKQGWGWKTNGMAITASYTNDPTAYVQIVGKDGDAACGTGVVTLNNPRSTAYRYGIFLINTNGMGTTTNAFPLTVGGVKP